MSKLFTYAKLNYLKLKLFRHLTRCIAQSAGAVEYTDVQRVRPPPNECPVYDTKQSDGEVPVMLELWGIWSTPSLPLSPGPLWPDMVVPDRVLSMS